MLLLLNLRENGIDSDANSDLTNLLGFGPHRGWTVPLVRPDLMDVSAPTLIVQSGGTPSPALCRSQNSSGRDSDPPAK